MVVVCVLDMDETCGHFDGTTFHVRPKFDFLINFLRLMRMDIVLWSLGADDYVKQIVNGYMPSVASHADKIFARRESDEAQRLYGWKKGSAHVRDMYNSEVLLVAVDDRVNDNMDEGYDLRLKVKPYVAVDVADRELANVVEQLTVFCLEHETRN